MNKQEHQDLWDELLIKCWRADMQMSTLIAMFLMDAKPSLLESRRSASFNDIQEVADFISSLDIRRCRDRKENGSLQFVSFIGPVRAFVARRCELLNNCLWNKENDAQEIIDNINNFKWIRKGPASARKRTNRILARKRKNASNKTLEMRSLAQKGQWDKVQ